MTWKILSPSVATRERSVPIFSTILLAGALLLGGRERGAAQLFPAIGQDTTTSMGAFQITVDPAFYPLLNPVGALVAYPGFNTSTGVLTSPLLIDNNTTIGRSASHTRPYFPGPAIPLDSPTFDTITGYGVYSLIPSLWSSAPSGLHEVLTEIENFTLVSVGSGSAGKQCPPDPRIPTVPISWPMVMAGTGAGVSPRSIGIVQQLPSSAPNDFPAQSFFDIFANVSLPPVPSTESMTAFPGSGALLYNDLPLLITNTSLTSFPPSVIYIHGMTPAVPVKFKANNPPYWSAGDIFGYLVLAGHGTITNDCNNVPAVQTLLNATFGPVGSPIPGMPVEWLRTNTSFPSPGSTYSSLTGVNFGGQTMDYLSFTGAGSTVYIRSLNIGPFPGPISPPPTGSSAVYSTTSVQGGFDYSTDGQNWYPATGTGPITVGITNTTAIGSTTSTYATEMTQLSLSGTIAILPSFSSFMLRESPTLHSTGQHTVRSDPRGYRVSSFFDVFPELSTDGGTTWIPANRAMRVQATAPPAAPNSIFPSISGTQVVLNWLGSFTLQSATNVAGPYTNVTGIPSTGSTNVITGRQQYFRLRE